MTKTRVAWLAALAIFLVHAIGNAHYGFFRDELYFIICGRHPQFGYVDQPPVVPLIAALTQLGGHSLWLLRIVPALFAAGGVYVTCLLAIELGGGIFAEVLAALVFLFSSVLMSFGTKVSTDEVGLLAWPLIAYLILRIVRGADARLWMLAGAVAGIAFESKYSVVFFIAAVVCGLLVTQPRVLLDRWFAAGAGIMLAIALPNIAWQAHYDFPMWELLRAGQNGKNIIVGPLVYLAQQVLITSLFLFPVWLIGLFALARDRTVRFLGIGYVVLITEMIVLHGKHYYPANVYPVLIAAGSAAIDRWTAGALPVRVAVLAYTLAFGPIFVPFTVPILSEPHYIAYQARIERLLHIPKSALATEHGRETTALPGDYADMHGWPQLAQIVKRVYDGLPPAKRAAAVVVASNYGEAAAIQFFAPGIPVISRHNQYWLWGTRGYSGNVVIDVNGNCGASEHLFASSKQVATLDAPYTIGWETGIPIMLCEGIRVPLATIWPQLKMYE